MGLGGVFSWGNMPADMPLVLYKRSRQWNHEANYPFGLRSSLDDTC